MTDDELRQARVAGLAAFKARRAPLSARLVEILGDGKVHGVLHQSAQADSALANAFTVLQGAEDPRRQLRWLEKFDQTSPDIPVLQAAVPGYLVLEQGYFTARAANSSLVALDDEKVTVELSMRLDDTIEAERNIPLANAELKRRGKPLKVPK